MGHFVPLGLFGLGGSGLVFLGRISLAGGRLVSLGRAATAGLLRLFVFLIGRVNLFCRGCSLTSLLTGGGKIHHLTGGGGLLFRLIRLRLLRDCHAGKLRRIRDGLAHFKEGGLSLMLQNELFLHGQRLWPLRGGGGG
ncbi:hypothetical protein, partial [Clostridioides difficile]|uniref:hypothetical protein n=1 Tax=Clostridioides difficile TaxID=1496 RepID=UPI001F1A67B6